MAVEHNLAINLEASDLKAMYDRGEFPGPNWKQEARSDAGEHASILRRGLLASFFWTVFFLVAGLGLAAVFGKIGTELAFAPAKILSALGGGLAAWATLFELGGFAETYSGKALHEVVRPVIFKLIFSLGVAIAALGQVW